MTRARWSNTDFWLLQLNQSPPWEYNVYYSGWNRTTQNSISGTVVGIHHPRGDIKKISWANGGVTRSAWDGAPYSGTTHWRVGSWSGGTTTEFGSSGSPLYSPQGHIIGQLTGGQSACGNTLPVWYGRIGASWTGGGTNSTRLRNWLDPDNTGLWAISGFDSRDIRGPSIVCTSNTSFNLATVPANSTVTWSFQPGNLVIPFSGSGSTATFRGASCSTIGNGTLTFKIDRPGHSTIYVSKTITVNGPDHNDVEFDAYYASGQPAPKSPAGNFLLCPHTNYHIYFMNNSICSTSNYSWTLPTGWTMNYQYQNMVSVNTNASPGGNVQVKGQTCCAACGSNVTLLSDYFGQYWNCGFGFFSVYPNPASNYFEIDIDSDKADEEILRSGREFNVTITDNMGMVKYTDRFREFPHRINTVNLTDGIYIVTISYDGDSFSTRLMIDN